MISCRPPPPGPSLTLGVTAATASLFFLQQVSQGFFPGREKESVLQAVGLCFRFNDVRETRDGDVDVIDAKDLSLAPRVVEFKSGHDESEIDDDSGGVDRGGVGAIRNHAFS